MQLLTGEEVEAGKAACSWRLPPGRGEGAPSSGMVKVKVVGQVEEGAGVTAQEPLQSARLNELRAKDTARYEH